MSYALFYIWIVIFKLLFFYLLLIFLRINLFLMLLVRYLLLLLFFHLNLLIIIIINHNLKTLLLLQLPRHPIHPILMRHTLYLRTQHSLPPLYLPLNPCIIHLLHLLILILFMENNRLVFSLPKYNQPRRQPIQPMQHKQPLISMLQL